MNVSLDDLIKEFMSSTPPRVIHLKNDASLKRRFSPTWCKRKGHGLVDETYTLLSTSNECSENIESSRSSSSSHEAMEFPKIERLHQGVHQRTGSTASTFNFASSVDIKDSYSSVGEAASIHHPAAWTSM